MRNFVQPANTVTLKAPRVLKAGDGVVIGGLFGVSANDVKAAGLDAEISIEGAFTFRRAAGVTLTEGAAANFDETTQTLVATGGAKIGFVIGSPSAADAISPDDPAYTWVKLVQGA